MGKLFEEWDGLEDGDEGELIPAPPTRYKAVIKALKQLVNALEVIDNGQLSKQRSVSASKRWAGKSPEEKRANTAAARKSKDKA